MTEATMEARKAPPKHVLLGLVLVALIQAGVLIGEWAMAHYPLWTGTELRLKVQPVDPRDLFRGNYVRLGYDISILPMELGDTSFRRGDVVYVTLVPDEAHGWVADGIHSDRPDSVPFLRARVQWARLGQQEVFLGMDEAGEPRREPISSLGAYHLRYGIEAWFAPKLRAQQIERELADGGWVTVKVADSGRAALEALDLEAP